MRIIVTGANGFVGRHVLKKLDGHDIVALDRNIESISGLPNVTKIKGDLQDPKILAQAFQRGCNAVIHLATLPGGAAENNPALAKSVNIDATMALIDMAAKSGSCPRFVFASSIAVFGKLPTTPVTDDTQTEPSMLYGAQKLMIENWIACQSRREAIKGISLRLPGIVARPRSPSGMKSAFMSDIFHALAAGEGYIMPVSKDATSWLCSVETAAKNLCLAATSISMTSLLDTPLLLPSLRVKMIDLEIEIRRQLSATGAIIKYSPDKNLQSIFGEHPEILTPKSESLGFAGDLNLEALVKSALDDLS